MLFQLQGHHIRCLGGSKLTCDEGGAGERPAVTGVGLTSPGFFTLTLYMERASKPGLLGQGSK